MPAFTILTPAFNHEKFLDECIRSAVDQTFTDWEMIILDDGSTDGTGSVARRWAASDHRIRYHHQENQGILALASTYNTGLSMASGKYISILEGDDLWETGKLQRQFAILEQQPEVVVTWGRARALVEGTGEIQRVSPPETTHANPLWTNNPAGSILNALYLENMIPAVTITIRKETLTAVGGFKQPPGFPTTDLPTLVDLALAGSFCFDERIMASWRVYSRQTTKMFPVEMLRNRWKFVKEHAASLPPRYRGIVSLTPAQIDRHFRKRDLVAHALSGRYRLMRGEFSQARKDYLKAIFYPVNGNLIWRLRAIIGFGYSLFQRNVESLARKMGKTSYQ